MTEDDGRRKRQRRIWIRVAIYVPLLLYFGWGALQKYRAEQAAAGASAEPDSPEDADPFEGLPSSEMTMPDGRKIRVLELSPEQAEELGLAPPDPPTVQGPATPDAHEAPGNDTDTGALEAGTETGDPAAAQEP